MKLQAWEIARANEYMARRASVIRTKAGLTQSQLAKRVGVPVETIRCLEEANYEGNALGM